jgi:choice-of-anchor C domain-containing protein
MSTDYGASWKKIIASVSVLVVLSPLCRFASAGNIVINGNFETPLAGRDFVMFQPGETFGGWTVATTWVDLVGTSVQAAGGVQSVDLSGGSAGQIYQDLATVPGQTYELRFALAGSGPELQTPRIKQMEVSWGSGLVDTLSFDTLGHSANNMGWTYHRYDLTAVSSVTRLQFTSLINTAWGPMLDDVRVTPVPEPAPVLLLGLGLGAMLLRMSTIGARNRYARTENDNDGMAASSCALCLYRKAGARA